LVGSKEFHNHLDALQGNLSRCRSSFDDGDLTGALEAAALFKDQYELGREHPPFDKFDPSELAKLLESDPEILFENIRGDVSDRYDWLDANADESDEAFFELKELMKQLRPDSPAVLQGLVATEAYPSEWDLWVVKYIFPPRKADFANCPSFDPNDPSPWMYRAHSARLRNEFVEAAMLIAATDYVDPKYIRGDVALTLDRLYDQVGREIINRGWAPSRTREAERLTI